VAGRAARTVATLAVALGLPLRRGESGELDPATADLVLRRDRARARSDWAEADAVRAELESTGWLVEDAAGGTRVRRR